MERVHGSDPVCDLSGMGEALLGTEGCLSGEPVIHVVSMGSTMVLIQEVGTEGHGFGGGNKGVSGRRGMHALPVGGFSVGRLSVGELRGVTGCCEILFHRRPIIPSHLRFSHGVFTPWPDDALFGMLPETCAIHHE